MTNARRSINAAVLHQQENMRPTGRICIEPLDGHDLESIERSFVCCTQKEALASWRQLLSS
jgi:hypothetical protein